MIDAPQRRSTIPTLVVNVWLWCVVRMMDPQDQDVNQQRGRPGKTRTWWHPLLARLLDHLLSAAYTVQQEVPVGKLPLRVDLLLVRRDEGQLSQTSQRDLAPLVPMLNCFTLIEFKGPTDALQLGDLAQLLGCARLWHSQQLPGVTVHDVSLIVLAPSINEALREELRCLGCQAVEQEPGIHGVAGVPYTTWLVETDVMASRNQPILTMVSRVFLIEPERIMGELRKSGHAPLLSYMLQQVEQFRMQGQEFAMQHTDTEHLGQVEEELVMAVLQSIGADRILEIISTERLLEIIPTEKLLEIIPTEKLLEIIPTEKLLEIIPTEKLLEIIPTEKLLEAMSPEKLAAGLSEEQARRLRELLGQ